MKANTHPRWVPVLSVVGVGVLLGSGLGITIDSTAAIAADAPATSPADLPEPSKEQLENSVQRWEPNNVMEWNSSESVEPLVTNKKDGDDAVITLASDVLFDFNSTKISGDAEEAIAKTVEKVPDGAKVTVSGYTDSVGDDAANKKLSKERAQAVADVIKDKRSDLDLSIKGFGEADPVAKNTTKKGDDNPQGRAKNRRVEISYDDS